eukprot:s590_g37.t1
MIAAVLLDTGGNLDETWAVFAKDFELPRSQVEPLLSVRPDHLSQLDGSEKEAQMARSCGLDVTGAPEFGKLPEGEGRKRLLDHCRRQGVKMRFEVEEAEAVAGEVRVKCVVGGRCLPEACGASMRHAQDLAAEVALWELMRPPTHRDAKFPPPSLPESLRPRDSTDFSEGQVDFEAKGLQHRFVESEEEDVDHTVTYRMRVAADGRTYPQASAKTKGEAQDLAAELALRELLSAKEPTQAAPSSEGRAREAQLQETVIQERSPDRDPWPFLALARPVEKDRASLALLAIFTFVLQDLSRLDTLPSAAREKGVDRQELQDYCSRPVCCM